MMYKIADLSQDNTHKTPEFMWKTQRGKKPIELLANFTIIERLQGEEENSRLLLQ